MLILVVLLHEEVADRQPVFIAHAVIHAGALLGKYSHGWRLLKLLLTVIAILRVEGAGQAQRLPEAEKAFLAVKLVHLLLSCNMV